MDENPAFSVFKDNKGRPVVPSVVPIRPISDDLLAMIRGWDAMEEAARAGLLAVARGLVGAQRSETRPG